jgi:hypothetical protein
VRLVVGAEEERKRLSQLLLQKEQLFGKRVTTIERENDLRKKKPVLGFGKEYAEIYDFGTKYDEKMDEIIDNSRFEGKISMEELPEIMKTRNSKK